METNVSYGSVSWTVDDVLSIRPHWTREQAQEELQANEKYLRDRLVELGWGVLDTLLPDFQEAVE